MKGGRMSDEKEMRAAGKAMRAYVENDPLIIAPKTPAVWAAGVAIAAVAIGIAWLSCLAAAAIVVS